MFIKNLSLEIISQKTTLKVFQRVEEYYEYGYVEEITKSEYEVVGLVQGSEDNSYVVCIEFNDQGIADTSCSCPYSFAGYCKHIVAVLLTCLYDHKTIEYQPSIQKKLATQSKEQLIQIILAAAKSHQETREIIEEMLAQ